MALIKCKMCGGDMQIIAGSTVAECEYCGTKQTLPKLDDERKSNLYDRANHFRRNNEFDKAMGLYEQILSEDRSDAELYWSLVLCRYGIKYVEDPRTHRRIPTINRVQYKSILSDEDYLSALQYADTSQSEVYEAEAKTIDKIQKGILSISKTEEPYDVFICYKETDEHGKRTVDSVLAQDLYKELTNDGLKVFFSRITLEDKLGTAYEPYIFAALNSAKVMVAIGTKPEYFNAVWVKNEWSRYLTLIRNGAEKTLIPAYRDMNPYDLPEEFSHLQGQDMSKLGFMQDLVRGVEKILNAGKEKVVVKVESETNTAALFQRVQMFMEDGEWENAEKYCERILDAEPTNANAYLYKLLISVRVTKVEDLAKCEEPLDNNLDFQKALRFANPALKEQMQGYNQAIKRRHEELRKDEIYNSACVKMQSKKVKVVQEAIEDFQSISDWKDAADLQVAAENRITQQKKQNPKKKILYVVAVLAVCGLMFGVVPSITETMKYNEMTELAENAQYDEVITMAPSAEKLYQLAMDRYNLQDYEGAAVLFKGCESFENAADWVTESNYQWAIQLKDSGEYERSLSLLEEIPEWYGETVALKNELQYEIQYELAKTFLENGKFDEALESIQSFKDDQKFRELKLEIKYQKAKSDMDNKEYQVAYRAFDFLNDYKDSAELYQEAQYLYGLEQISNGDYYSAGLTFRLIKNYKNSLEMESKAHNLFIEKGIELNLNSVFTKNSNDLQVHSVVVKLSKDEKEYTFVIDCSLPKNMNIMGWGFYDWGHRMESFNGYSGRHTYSVTCPSTMESIYLNFYDMNNDIKGSIEITPKDFYT